MNEEMMKAMAGKQMPEMAIVESNTLAAMGLRQLLESVMPMMKSRPSVRSVSTRQTILTTLFIVCIYAHCTGTPLLLHTGQQEPPRDRSNTQQRSQFATCRISLSLRQCTRRIPDKEFLNLQHSGHPHGEHIPAMPPVTQEKFCRIEK